LGIEDASDVAVFTILTIPDNFREATANLLAPVVINIRTNLGLQYIPRISDYTTKHSIFPAINSQSAVGKGK
jgi:flagellar assembly factor FliW